MPHRLQRIAVSLLAAATVVAGEGWVELSQDTMPVTIDQPGSYILTMPLTGVSGSHGIRVVASGVTIDLNGFGLQGVAGAGCGIVSAPGQTNLTVLNGVVGGWGGDGIDASLASNGVFRGLTLFRNGTNGLNSGFTSLVRDCTSHHNGNIGIEAENGSVVERCVVYENVQHGLDVHSGSTVSDCTLIHNGHDGIHGSHGTTVLRCTSRDNLASGDGIEVDTGSIVRNCAVAGNEDGIRIINGGGLVVDCVASSNRDDGVDVDVGSLVKHCTVSYNAGHGIRVADRCTAIGNMSVGNEKAGLKAAGSGSRVEGNTALNNGRGIFVESGGNIVLGNVTSGNTNKNWDVAAGNAFQQQSVSGASVPADAWMNVSY